ncbi:MAG: tRNA (adenosine(37)-N6)-threonylcarbamoyltransferase complex ATPase subunit type 1 TsaE [Candidatus Gastranaerophilaceae bacterium]|jgi:tRNA threonylcarbamoyladenosine biosynthesis protein TsaE
MKTEFKIQANNLDDTSKIATAISKAMITAKGGLICLYGDIGSGKTTLTKEIAKNLKIKEKVTSPSFVILNEYHSGIISLYHFDLYRLEKEGLETIIDEIVEYTSGENSLAIVEWAEFSFEQLPKDRLEVKIEYVDDSSRIFYFKSHGDKNSIILENIIKDALYEYPAPYNSSKALINGRITKGTGS